MNKIYLIFWFCFLFLLVCFGIFAVSFGPLNNGKYMIGVYSAAATALVYGLYINALLYWAKLKIFSANQAPLVAKTSQTNKKEKSKTSEQGPVNSNRFIPVFDKLLIAYNGVTLAGATFAFFGYRQTGSMISFEWPFNYLIFFILSSFIALAAFLISAHETRYISRLAVIQKLPKTNEIQSGKETPVLLFGFLFIFIMGLFLFTFVLANAYYPVSFIQSSPVFTFKVSRIFTEIFEIISREYLPLVLIFFILEETGKLASFYTEDKNSTDIKNKKPEQSIGIHYTLAAILLIGGWGSGLVFTEAGGYLPGVQTAVWAGRASLLIFGIYMIAAAMKIAPVMQSRWALTSLWNTENKQKEKTTGLIPGRENTMRKLAENNAYLARTFLIFYGFSKILGIIPGVDVFLHNTIWADAQTVLLFCILTICLAIHFYLESYIFYKIKPLNKMNNKRGLMYGKNQTDYSLIFINSAAYLTAAMVLCLWFYTGFSQAMTQKIQGLYLAYSSNMPIWYVNRWFLYGFSYLFFAFFVLIITFSGKNLLKLQLSDKSGPLLAEFKPKKG